MTHTDYDDRESPDKIPVKVNLSNRLIDSGDWWEIDDFRVFLDAGEKTIRRQKRYKNNPAYMFLKIDDDYELNLEFWGERMESDEEFAKRQKNLANYKKAKRVNDIANLKALAEEHGFDLVEKLNK